LATIREVPPRLAPIEDLLWIEDLAVAKEVNAYPHRYSIGRSIKESG
jgi:hypothetical protein